MLDMRLKLESRVTTIKQERERLRALLELMESKKQMTKTIKKLDNIVDIDDAEISSIAEQIRQRIDREDARQEIASMRLQEEIEETVGTNQVELQLDERKRRLGMGDE